MYNAKILLDSISETGKRITTFEITFPRIVLAEFNTHRMFSRNSASSRAIPFSKMFQRVDENPYIPERFPIDGKGMQPNSYIYGNSDVYLEAKRQWLLARDSAMSSAKILYNCLQKYEDEVHLEVKVHKQIVNRLLEPFMWHTVLVTATEFDNFFKLRTDENAQYEIRRIADLMYDLYHNNSNINELKSNNWHLPLINIVEDFEQIIETFKSQRDLVFGKEQIDFRPYGVFNQYVMNLLRKISVARCARVSYLTHDGKRDIEKDLELFERLRTSGHWSPFEHVATPFFETNDFSSDGSFNEEEYGKKVFHNEKYMNKRSGNFIGWKQFRKEFQDENCTYFRKGE